MLFCRQNGDPDQLDKIVTDKLSGFVLALMGEYFRLTQTRIELEVGTCNYDITVKYTRVRLFEANGFSTKMPALQCSYVDKKSCTLGARGSSLSAANNSGCDRERLG